MVVKIAGIDNIKARIFRSGNGGSINLIIPKIFVFEMGLEPSDTVSIFYNRQLKRLEIKKDEDQDLKKIKVKPKIKVKR